VRILISAGEASGEMYGAQLMTALRAQFSEETSLQTAPAERSSPASSAAFAGEDAGGTSALEFFGVGGDRMRAAGCDIVVDARELAVVGITEILSHLPKIWGRFHQLMEEADRRKPGLAIVIDSPAFNWRVAREMKRRGVPVVYYVCPQFWAWRQGRVKLLRKYVDKALVIFPFEEKFYRDRGVDAEFVGHPLAELPQPDIKRAAYAAQFRLDPARHWITLMPGSRVKEVRMNLATMIDASLLLGRDYEYLLPVAPTLDRDFLRREIGRASSDDRDSGRTELPNIHLVPEALAALRHSRAGIIASGTATVEAAMMETPFVMVYRVTPLTYLLGRSTVKVPYFAMVNLIAEERVVSELVQQDFTAEAVVKELNRVIADGPERERMLNGLRKIRAKLRGAEESGGHAAAKAAKAIAAMKSKPASAVEL
jgi:lipid-A-disaccharide synthase